MLKNESLARRSWFFGSGDHRLIPPRFAPAGNKGWLTHRFQLIEDNRLLTVLLNVCALLSYPIGNLFTALSSFCHNSNAWCVSTKRKSERKKSRCSYLPTVIIDVKANSETVTLAACISRSPGGHEGKKGEEKLAKNDFYLKIDQCVYPSKAHPRWNWFTEYWNMRPPPWLETKHILPKTTFLSN